MPSACCSAVPWNLASSMVGALSSAPCVHRSTWEGERESCFFKTRSLTFHLSEDHGAQFNHTVTPAFKGGSELYPCGPCLKGESDAWEQAAALPHQAPCSALLGEFSVAQVGPAVPVSSTLCGPVAKSHLTLCDPMDCSTPVFPVLHCLPELAQTHVH